MSTDKHLAFRKIGQYYSTGYGFEVVDLGPNLSLRYVFDGDLLFLYKKVNFNGYPLVILFGEDNIKWIYCGMHFHFKIIQQDSFSHIISHEAVPDGLVFCLNRGIITCIKASELQQFHEDQVYAVEFNKEIDFNFDNCPEDFYRDDLLDAMNSLKL